MGAIILNNYVASYGSECALNGAIAVSGGLDLRYQEHFYRARRLWQPMLAEDLRDKFLLGKWGIRVKAKLSKDELLRLMRASDVTVRSKGVSRAGYGKSRFFRILSSSLTHSTFNSFF